jgi:hypothetical protein|tara:strand:+ start:648 stop:1067 length:420 start_codon:yes stop_codon:yes gene_type:complete
MKKILLLLIIILSLTSFKNTSESDFNIVGKWKGGDNNEIGYFVFLEENYAYFEVQGQIIGGKEFEIKGKKGSMKYVIDYTTNPIQFDFITTRFDTKETLELFGIIDVINKNEIKISLGFNGSRPTKFDTDDAITFIRVE